MHIPDGFLDAKTAIAAGLAAVAGLAIAVPRLERTLPPRQVPLLGLSAAFVFAAQMLNFPVGGGTSGHLIGSVLVTALLGPAAAVVVLTAVLLTQCLLFADGGITALGANVFNMAVLAPASGALLLRLAQKLVPGPRGLVLGGAFAGWVSVVLASMACAAQLAWSGTAAFGVAFPAMVSVHLVIGVGEGLITALVLVALVRVRPDLVDPQGAALGRTPWLGVAALVGGLLFVAPFACPLPDGLERVAEQLGFAKVAHAASAPLPDYEAGFVSSPVLATLLAGAIGAAVVFALAWLLARALVPTAATDGRD